MKNKTFALLLLAVAFAIAIHQYLVWGYLFEVKDIHHELFISSFAFAGLIVYFYPQIRRFKWRLE